jgi:hypothetical protein
MPNTTNRTPIVILSGRDFGMVNFLPKIDILRCAGPTRLVFSSIMSEFFSKTLFEETGRRPSLYRHLASEWAHMMPFGANGEKADAARQKKF